MRTRVLDHRFRHVVAQRRLPEALIKAHAAGVGLAGIVLVGVGRLGIDVADVDRHVLAEIRQGDGGGDAGIAGDDDAERLHMAEPGGRHENAQLFAFLDPAFESGRPDDADDALDLVGRGAQFAQDRADRLAFFDDDLALAPVAAAVRLVARLRQQRDILRNHARRRSRNNRRRRARRRSRVSGSASSSHRRASCCRSPDEAADSRTRGHHVVERQ